MMPAAVSSWVHRLVGVSHCSCLLQRRALSTGRAWKPQVVAPKQHSHTNPNNSNDDNDPRKVLARNSEDGRPTTRMGMLAWDYQQQIKESGIPQRGDLSAWEALANHKIRESMDKGDFDDLQGKGKPLRDIGAVPTR